MSTAHSSTHVTKSQALYARATELMPWGTQTNAKRPSAVQQAYAPLFFERGEGCRLQSVDGDWYIDYRSALGPIILGYAHPVVDAAVRAQLEKGVLFSMASPLEVTVAEQLTALIPGLDQVRFLKTGNDANTAAVRLARAFTQRDAILTCGYHGFGDWFASGTGASPMLPRPGNGVPELLDPLVTRVTYGDLATLEQLFAEKGDEIAALIMVPYDWGETVAETFIQRARALTHTYGTVLIFDQVLTGFRLALGGAQEFFGVVPDLTTYAKALANGFPLSAYGGRRDIMEMLYQSIITTTYAGETLSLAAAQATLTVLQEEPVIDHIWAMGQRLQAGFDKAAGQLGLAACSYGLPPSVGFRFSADPTLNEEATQIFHRELYQRGIFAPHQFLLSYAHKAADIDETVRAMEHALAVVAEEKLGLA